MLTQLSPTLPPVRAGTLFKVVTEHRRGTAAVEGVHPACRPGPSRPAAETVGQCVPAVAMTTPGPVGSNQWPAQSQYYQHQWLGGLPAVGGGGGITAFDAAAAAGRPPTDDATGSR